MTAPKISETDLKTAVAFETALRDWGTDPTIQPKDLAQQDAKTVLNRLRTPDSLPKPTILNDVKTGDGVGPDAKSLPCAQGMAAQCAEAPTMLAWLRDETWAVGSKWTDGPHAERHGTAIRVTGTVKGILLQDGDTWQAGGMSNITPAWTSYRIDDTLTIKDGRITGISPTGDDYWWIDPWLKPWDGELPKTVGASSSTTRVGIPIQGSVDMGLHHYGLMRILTHPDGQSADGYDMTLWNNVRSTTPSNDDMDQLKQDCIAQYGDQCPLA
ncbi:hypothetical protein [Bifidobacterium felsineum]|uniref:hypothetical protein n=1 Tax=Bifidobacterium felsineum TaxID=2045440 RepID=UPI001BDC08D1|nr:hypothetical protein [Bifidobacterium felsineum]MBT1164550.1 hypothetical protein [Bifidobacterium felsineum]